MRAGAVIVLVLSCEKGVVSLSNASRSRKLGAVNLNVKVRFWRFFDLLKVEFHCFSVRGFRYTVCEWYYLCTSALDMLARVDASAPCPYRKTMK